MTADHVYDGLHGAGQQLLQALAADVAQEFLAADGEQSAAGFKTRTTVGIMFDRCVIDNMVVGGPAYNSRQLDRGDLVVEIDGRPVDKDSLSQMLVGKDVAGTPVAITVKKGGKTGAKKTVTLLRMPSEAIADRRRLFELFTTMKARATLPRGRETVEGMIDNAIELWTRMTIADSDRDAKTRSKVAGMQERAQGFVTELMQNDEAKRALYFERHDDVLQLGDRVEHAQLETARLTLALKEAEAENDRLKEANQELEVQLRDAKSAIETLNKDAADAAAESEASRAKGMDERMEMDKLKREFALQEATIQNQQQLKRDLEAQIERLTNTVSEVNEQLQKAWTDAEIAEANFVKTVTGLKQEKAEIGADCQIRVAQLEADSDELQGCKSAHQREREGLVTELYGALQAIRDMHMSVRLPPGLTARTVPDSTGPAAGTKKKKKGRAGGAGTLQKESAVGDSATAHDMTLDMFSEGSMEERDAHVVRIYASMNSDTDSDTDSKYLVQLPEGFGKGEFAQGNSIFVQKLADRVTVNARTLHDAVVSLQAGMDEATQRVGVLEDQRRELEERQNATQKDLNDTRAMLTEQTQRNAESTSALRQSEQEACDLKAKLMGVDATKSQLADRVEALTNKSAALSTRVSDLESQEEAATRQTDKLESQVASLKADLRAAELRSTDAEALRKQAESQLANLVYSLDRSEASAKLKDAELQDSKKQIKALSSGTVELKATTEQQQRKIADFKQSLHDTKQHLQQETWRVKTLSDDIAAASRREEHLRSSMAEMDATIMQLEEAKNSLSAEAETRQRHNDKLAADLARSVDEIKELQTRLREMEKVNADMKTEHNKALKEKTTELHTSLSAIEEMHTCVCQPQVGIAKGIGVTLEQVDGSEGCRVQSIIQKGVAETEGTLQVGDKIEQVDGLDVSGCLFEEVHGLLVGVAGSSVTISGLHVPYSPEDAFSVVLVRAGVDNSHAHAMSTMQVDDLAGDVLMEAGALRSALLDLKSQKTKFASQLQHEAERVSEMEKERKNWKQEMAEIRVKYEGEVARAVDMTKAKKKAEEALETALHELDREKVALRRLEAELKALSVEREHLISMAKETGDELLNKKHALSRAQEDLKSLKQQAAQHLKTITEEQTVRQKGEVQIAQLAYQLDLAQAKIKTLKDEVKEFESTSQKQKEEISDLKTLVNSKEKEVHSALASIRHSHTVVCQRTVGVARGIGITLHALESGETRIESIIPGGVAEQEGSLRPNDLVTQIDRVSVMNNSLDEIHDLLSGSAGSSLTILAKREDQDVRAILFRAGVESHCDNAHELCGEVTDAALSQRSQLATSANALREITMKYEHLKADHSREMEHSQRQVEESRAKCERLGSRNSDLQLAIKNTEAQLTASQSKVDTLEAQNSKSQHDLQRLSGVHEQLKVSMDEMKTQFSETVTELQDLNDKLQQSQQQIKESAVSRAAMEQKIEDQGLLLQRLEKHLDSEQAHGKELQEDVKTLKKLVSDKEAEFSELKGKLTQNQREKEDLEQAHNHVKRDFEEQARKIKSLDNEFNETQGKLRKETDCVATLTSAIDRASDVEKKITREANDLKRKVDAEIFAKDQSLRREEALKRSLAESREHAVEYKAQAEADVTHLRKEIGGICSAVQRTHAKVCGQSVGSFAGVGLFLIDSDSSAGRVEVESVVPGRSAALDGRVAAGDVLLEVDGEDVREKRFEYVNSLLAGETGSSVTIKAQKGVGGGFYTANFVRSSAKSRCTNSEDVSELCREVEMVQDTLKHEERKLREQLAAEQRRRTEDRDTAARDHVQLTTQLEDAQAKISQMVQKIVDVGTEKTVLESQLISSNEVSDHLRAEIEGMQVQLTKNEQLRRDMEDKFKGHEKILRHWVAEHAVVLRDQEKKLTQAFLDLESEVLDTARNNVRYANELDRLQVVMSTVEPELIDVKKRLLTREQEVSKLQDRVRVLEHECHLHDVNRGDILAQLQDALLREADLRENAAALERQRLEFKEKLGDSEGHNNQLDLKVKRLLDQIKLMETKASEARDLDQTRQQELTCLTRKLSDVNDKFSVQVADLSKDVDVAYNAARQMHLAVCKPVVGLTSGIGILIASAGKAGGCRVTSVDSRGASTKNQLQIGDLILEVGGKSVRKCDVSSVQDSLAGPLGSEVKILVQSVDSDNTRLVTVKRGTGGTASSSVMPDLLGEVRIVAAKLHDEQDRLRRDNIHLRDKISQKDVTHEEELRRLRAAQADLQMQLDAQLRNVADKDRACRTLQTNVKELNLRINELEKQQHAAQSKVQEKSDEIARLEALRDDLKAGNATARESMRKASAEIKGMQGKIEAQADEISALDRLKREFLSKIDARDFELAEMRKQVASLSERHKELEVEVDRQIKEKKTIATDAVRDCAIMQEQVQTLNLQVRDLQSNLSDKAALLDASDNDLRAAEKSNAERQKTIEDLEKRLKASQAKQHQLNDELARTTAELNRIKDLALEEGTQKNAAILKLQDALEKERMLVETVSKKLAEVEKTKNEFKSKVDVLEPRTRDLEKSIKAASSRELEMKDEISRLMKELESLKSSSSGTVSDLQEQIAKLRTELQATKNDLASTKAKVSDAEFAAEAAGRRVAEDEMIIENLEKQLRDQLARLQELEARLQEQRAEASKWEAQSSELESEAMRKAMKLKELEAELERIRKQVEEGGSCRTEIQRQLQDALQRVSALEDELKRAKKEGSDLLKQIQMLEDQRDKLLVLQDDLMKRIAAHEKRRQNVVDKGMMTEAPKPAPVIAKKVEPPKLCGLGMRVTEVAPHRIVELIEGGAAKESMKLMVGDHILNIAGNETEHLSMTQVRDLIVGPVGSVVALKVSRQGEIFDMMLTRAEISRPDSARKKETLSAFGGLFGTAKW